MSKYQLNPRFEKLSAEEIFNFLLNSIKIGQSYKTLSGRKEHRIIKLKGEITVERLGASNKPEISFDEFLDVITLFKSGGLYNTTSKEYKDQLKKPIHKTPLLSILFALDIIIKD